MLCDKHALLPCVARKTTLQIKNEQQNLNISTEI